MTVRLAALITTCAAALLWYSEPLKSEDLAGTCVSSKAPRSDVIAACTNLIEDEGTTPEFRHLYLTERAWSYRSDDKFDLAIADVDHALEMQPDNYKTWILRAKIHEANDDHELALADYDKAVEIGSESSFTHWKRARFLDCHGNRSEAFKGFQRALDLNPNASNAAYYMVVYLFDTDGFEQAALEIEDAIKRWPHKIWPYEAKSS